MNPFTYEGESFFSIGAVRDKIGTFKTMGEEAKFLDAYCKFSAHGFGNLCYFIGNPYAFAYYAHHPEKKRLDILKAEVDYISKNMQAGFNDSEYSKRGL